MPTEMRRGAPVRILELTAEQREALERWVRRPTTAQGLAQRAEIILECATGESDVQIARKLRSHRLTVGRWRRRFVRDGVDGLLDEPRPGAPRKIGDSDVERVITRTLETKPRDATHWSTRSMAKALGMSQSAISRIWRAFSLQPHRSETFKLSRDPLFIEKIRDIVGLYMHPPERALVLCVDEKSQIQALDRTAPLLPLRPGQPERRTHDYVRHGTTSLFAALDVKTGKVIGECLPRQRAIEFRKFLDTIDAAIPADLDVHVVLDNLSTHKAPVVKRWLAKRPRYHLHFTPTSSSWLNLVERFFAELTEKQIKRGIHRSTRALIEAIENFVDVRNEEPRPFIWTKSADEILASIARFCRRTSDSGH
jgi:transposase